ncbi:hypothetical protein OBE_11460, partial [human gut metagenome]
VDKAIEKARELNCSGTIWNGALLHLEYSARKKLHIDIRMPIGMTIEETQRAYCEALGVPYDESCITPERMLFITDKESEIYRSPHWYEVLPAGRAEEAQTSLPGPWTHYRRANPARHPAKTTQHSTFKTQHSTKCSRPSTSGL